jgi:hypothetical protein
VLRFRFEMFDLLSMDGKHLCQLPNRKESDQSVEKKLQSWSKKITTSTSEDKNVERYLIQITRT